MKPNWKNIAIVCCIATVAAGPIAYGASLLVPDDPIMQMVLSGMLGVLLGVATGMQFPFFGRRP